MLRHFARALRKNRERESRAMEHCKRFRRPSERALQLTLPFKSGFEIEMDCEFLSPRDTDWCSNLPGMLRCRMRGFSLALAVMA